MLLAIAYVGIFMMLPNMPRLTLDQMLKVLTIPASISIGIMVFRDANYGKFSLFFVVCLGIFLILPPPFLSIVAYLTVLIWPVFVAFAVVLYRNADFNKLQSIKETFEKIQPKLKELIMLGLLCLIYATIITFILNSDLESIFSIVEGKKNLSSSESELLFDKFFPFMLKLLLLLAPLFVATWFSPVLIAVNNYTLVNAIKSSIAGVLQYTIAMGAAWLVLSAGIMGLMLAAGLIIGILGALVPVLAQALMPMLVFGCLLLATALMFAFQYVSYRDVFRAAPVEVA
jgi:hypothetical protein